MLAYGTHVGHDGAEGMGVLLAREKKVLEMVTENILV